MRAAGNWSVAGLKPSAVPCAVGQGIRRDRGLIPETFLGSRKTRLIGRALNANRRLLPTFPHTEHHLKTHLSLWDGTTIRLQRPRAG